MFELTRTQLLVGVAFTVFAVAVLLLTRLLDRRVIEHEVRRFYRDMARADIPSYGHYDGGPPRLPEWDGATFDWPDTGPRALLASVPAPDWQFSDRHPSGPLPTFTPAFDARATAAQPAFSPAPVPADAADDLDDFLARMRADADRFITSLSQPLPG